ncbi:glycosyltransferase 87 family protein [Amnibacterium flavum]|uniref:glycosyltransferase 87 family protein n=1 Tax=Amnibacterium flavum TaxID=2173173 RepID=UPI001F0C15DB|nr:glycosyltransferase 87 family protein [Amnibacterium flavum]
MVELSGVLVAFRSVRPERLFFLVAAGGAAVRVLLILFLVPQIQSAWFTPFFATFWQQPSIDPWQTYLSQGGDPQAFPYGPVMFLWFLFWTGITLWLPSSFSIQIGIALGLLAADVLICVVLRHRVRNGGRAATTLFIIAPIVIYATYVHGQLDLVPTLLMLLSALDLRDRRWRRSGVFIGLAIAAKLSSALVPPLVLIFLLRNARWRRYTLPYVLGLTPGLLLAALPSFLPGYRIMVTETPMLLSVVEYAVDLGPGLTIVVLPVVYAAILGLQYTKKRSNPDLLVMLIGIALTATTLLTPASPGWFVWSVPILAILVVVSGYRVTLVTWLFWAAATVTVALRASGADYRAADPVQPSDFVEVGSFVMNSGVLGPVLATATVAIGAVALLMVYRGYGARHDLYALSSAPLSVAIAGDSGTGKDTLCISLANVFGEDATAFVMGDDYHHYERGAPVWKNTTHLHPATNDLSGLSRDALSLMRGRGVWAKHYDHSRGRFTKQRPVHHRELVVINGLHALVSADVRRAADLTVFTSMDERLRRQLKINRDVGERGQSLETVVSSIERRYEHADRFVTPQAELADIVFRIEPISALPEDDAVRSTHHELRLIAQLRDLSFAEELQRSLSAIAGVASTIEYQDQPGRIRFTTYPELLDPADTAAVASQLVKRSRELFVGAPQWLGKTRGVMQLIVVLAMLERRRNRTEGPSRK